ncbi:hypothetical protein [Sphingomonas alba]|uniref:Uncharacterized protein n=1 Tax=Sphingomonas alba TaxID=2908208 RepID=A0ABT0RL48_9SPHN|nr:hypothetical protein [Sphingomonas alba]MCL6683374.1 hypothetical protein [Sphingomonas alba]
MFKTLMAGALLTLGAGVALGQTEIPPDSTAPATADVQATAKEDPAPAAGAAASTDAQASAKADPAANADVSASGETDAKADLADARKAKKAKQKAECLKVNVGKPHDC